MYSPDSGKDTMIVFLCRIPKFNDNIKVYSPNSGKDPIIVFLCRILKFNDNIKDKIL
jgi:hypothetical protein